MTVQRGDVVLIDYPYSTGRGAKVRPVLVVQNDRDNRRLTNTIIAQITSVTRRASEPTQLFIELLTPDGQQSGLRQDSVVNCANLLTLDRDKVLRRLGSLPESTMARVDGCSTQVPGRQVSAFSALFPVPSRRSRLRRGSLFPLSL